jgi:LacI family transcriptional regulator
MSKSRRPTILDVAKLAGVSIGTTSNVLNRKTGVSDEALSKVNSAAKTLNYHPSFAARILRKEKSSLISLHLCILPDGNIHPSTWSYYFPIIQGFLHGAKQRGFRAHLELTSTDELEDVTYLESFLVGYQISGAAFILPYSGKFPGLFTLKARNHCIITIGSRISDSIPSVRTDDFEAATRAVEWLRGMGHSRIGYINGEQSHFAAELRKKAYLRVMKDTGYRMVFDGDWTIESGVEGLKYFIAQKNTPSAIFCANDHMAIGVLKACRTLRISVPDDLSVVGFDDDYICNVSSPELTTVNMPLFEIGEEAVNSLLPGPTDHGVSNLHRVLPSELIVRNSAVPFFQRNQADSGITGARE